jgi:beta-lactamase class A
VILVCFQRRALLALVMAIVGLAGIAALQVTPASATPAEGLAARVECQEESLNVTFTWQPSGAGQQWLDVGHDVSFAPGTFAGTGPFTSNQESFVWDDPRPNSAYFVRINTQDGDAWSASTTLSLNTPPCGAVAPSPGMLDLQTRLEQQVASANFRTAVAVTDLQTGETISVNGDRQQFTGCTMNLFALMQAVVDLQNGQYEESRVGDLIAATIYGSNPVTARDILLISGEGDIVTAMNKINALLEKMGLTDTFYDHPPAYWPAPTLRNISNLTTALDVNRALSALWNGTVVSVEWRDYLFEKMTGVKPGLNYLIPAGVTDGVVGHKNGFFWLPDGWIDNDAGVVTFQRGGQTYAYAITMLMEAIPGEYVDIPMGQAISSMVYQYFSATYP